MCYNEREYLVNLDMLYNKYEESHSLFRDVGMAQAYKNHSNWNGVIDTTHTFLSAIPISI